MGGILISEAHSPQGPAPAPLPPIDLVIDQPALYPVLSAVGAVNINPAQVESPNRYYAAACASDDQVGACVYAAPDDTQARVATADANAFQPVCGVLVAKTTAESCIVQSAGYVVGVIQNLVPGCNYFLGHMGAVVRPPLDDDNIQFVQLVGRATDPGALQLTLSGQVFRRNTSG